LRERKRAPRRRWPPTEGPDCHVGRRRDCSNLRADGMTDISFKSASALAGDIKAKKIGCREALDHFWSRVERFNPQINAIVVSDIDRARAKASNADAGGVPARLRRRTVSAYYFGRWQASSDDRTTVLDWHLYFGRTPRHGGTDWPYGERASGRRPDHREGIRRSRLHWFCPAARTRVLRVRSPARICGLSSTPAGS
jgi:hypothetical protein